MFGASDLAKKTARGVQSSDLGRGERREERGERRDERVKLVGDVLSIQSKTHQYQYT